MKKHCKISIEFIKELANQKNGLCLSTMVSAVTDSLLFRCAYGHTWTTRAHSLIYDKTWCPKCYKNKVKDLSKKREYIRLQKCKIYAKQHGGSVLSAKCSSCTQKISWMCSKHHKFIGSLYSIVKAKRWCAVCSKGKRQLTIKDIQDIAKTRGGKCLTNKYTNVSTRMKFRCSNGHTWTTIANSILNRNYWCPVCKSSRQEAIVREIIQQIFNEKFYKVRPSWLRSSKGGTLELDGYCNKLNLAFEYQGPHHYKKTKYAKEGLEAILRRDKEKLELCKLNKVKLAYITELDSSWSKNTVIKHIINCLSFHNVKIPRIPVDISIHNLYKTDLDDIRNIVKQRNGKLLANEYLGDRIKLNIVCNKGHNFKLAPHELKRGVWCSHCSGNNLGTLNEYVDLAKKYNGVCLSSKYTNSHTKLRFKCALGHIFEIRPYCVKHAGQWCPTCAHPTGSKKDVFTQMCA